MAETSPAGAKRMLCGGIFHLPDGRVIESLAEYEIRDGQFLPLNKPAEPLNELAGSPPEPKQPAPEPVERRDCLDCAKEPPWRPWQPEIQDEAREGRCGARLLVRTGEQVWDHHACTPVGPCRAWRPKDQAAPRPEARVSGGGAGRGFEGSAPTVEPGGPAAGGAQSGSPSRAARKPPAKPKQLTLF